MFFCILFFRQRKILILCCHHKLIQLIWKQKHLLLPSFFLLYFLLFFLHFFSFTSGGFSQVQARSLLPSFSPSLSSSSSSCWVSELRSEWAPVQAGLPTVLLPWATHSSITPGRPSPNSGWRDGPSREVTLRGVWVLIRSQPESKRLGCCSCLWFMTLKA